MRVVLDGVFNHTGRGFWPFHHVLETGAGVAVPRLVPPRRRGVLDGGRPLRRLSAARTRPQRRVAGLRGLVGHAGAAEAQHRRARGPRVPVGRRRALAPLRHRRLAAGRPGEIDDEAFWQEFRRRCRAIRPDAYLVGEIWHVAPGLAPRRPLRRADELPARRGDHRLRRRATGSTRRCVRVAPRVPASIRPLDGPASPARLAELLRRYDPDDVAVQLNLLGSHDTPRLRTVLGGDRRRPAGDAAPGDAARCARASTTATRSA